MASDLPPEQHASYSAIIDNILATADLSTVSAKRIRKGLQEQVDYDITPQKDAITELIMQRFDKVSKAAASPSPASAAEPAPTANGHIKPEPQPESSAPTSPPKRKASASADSDLSDVASPPAKKPKKAPKVKTETDEQIAKRMQAEFNASSGRATRGGGVTKRKPVAKKVKTPKKKSKAKVNSDDDSEVHNSDSDAKEAKVRKGGFHKPMHLSPALTSLLGHSELSRPQTVKKIWAYVKERDLQDPSDKRQIRCDEAMRAVFKQDKVHMFTMNKLLAQHLWPVEDAGEGVKGEVVKEEEDEEEED
ncbi:uncharacterized protein LTR77_002243 [Saxophila tyrrhenica]|uniref:DM2 domain-containing protein n=1 Tax=Saxophila tyrrhenica TaxID=1690608 RepID=A0AAV9PKQ7_9PEZI|nr:hypothetical protein LTR77_002243 [Saxophila tyrrhenica]